MCTRCARGAHAVHTRWSNQQGSCNQRVYMCHIYTHMCLQLGAQLEELAVHLVAHPGQPTARLPLAPRRLVRTARVGIGHRRPDLPHHAERCGVVRRGAGWCGEVQGGAERCGVVRRGAGWCGEVRRGAEWGGEGAEWGGEVALRGTRRAVLAGGGAKRGQRACGVVEGVQRG